MADNNTTPINANSDSIAIELIFCQMTAKTRFSSFSCTSGVFGTASIHDE
jgi:hypothetical protein